MTTCLRCGLKTGSKDDPATETPRCNRCFELTDEQVRAVLAMLKYVPADWDDGTITLSIEAFAALAMREVHA